MVRIGYALGLAQAEAGAPATGLVTVQTAQRFTPDGHPNLDYVEGLCAFGAGDLDRAEACFREALACDGRNFSQPVLPFITNELLARIKLAGVALTRGFPEDALAVLPSGGGGCVCPRAPGASRVDLVRAEVELARGDASAAMEILSTFVDLPRLAPDWHVLVHRAMTELGQNTDGPARGGGRRGQHGLARAAATDRHARTSLKRHREGPDESGGRPGWIPDGRRSMRRSRCGSEARHVALEELLLELELLQPAPARPRSARGRPSPGTPRSGASSRCP